MRSLDPIKVEAPSHPSRPARHALDLRIAPKLEVLHVIDDHAEWLKCGHFSVVLHVIAGPQNHANFGILVRPHLTRGNRLLGVQVAAETLHSVDRSATRPPHPSTAHS